MTGDADQLLVIESFLVTGGRVLGWARHRDRFLAAVAAVRPEARRTAEAAWVPGVLDVPDGERWFPRCELRADGHVRWRWRPAPEESEELAVAATPVVDERRRPDIKGYELGWLEAVRAGGPDVVLVGPDGRVRETTTAALVLWRDNQPLTADGPALASTTLAWMEAERGEPLCRVPLRFEDLSDPDAEVWALNAAHGPRRLRVDGAPVGHRRGRPSGRLREWRQRWVDGHGEVP